MNKLMVIHTHLFSMTASALLHLQERVPELEVVYIRHDAVTDAQMADVEILLGCPPPERLRHAPKLQWMHLTNAGIEPYGDLRLFANNRVLLTNASGVYGTSIAEHGVGLMLALCRRFPYYARQTQAHSWQRREDVRELQGATVAVFGLGDLGSNVARRVKAFGCTVLGVRNNILIKPDGVDELFALHHKPEVLRRSSFTVNCLPHTRDTAGLFDAAAFAAMPSGSVFVNLGRGGAVDESALADALESGHLFGAGLDVTHIEPLPPDSPLWDAENILITAHSSAASPLVDERNLRLFTEQLERWRQHRPMKNTVDFFRGY